VNSAEEMCEQCHQLRGWGVFICCTCLHTPSSSNTFIALLLPPPSRSSSSVDGVQDVMNSLSLMSQEQWQPLVMGAGHVYSMTAAAPLHRACCHLYDWLLPAAAFQPQQLLSCKRCCHGHTLVAKHMNTHVDNSVSTGILSRHSQHTASTARCVRLDN
jgi:hypothetical protein